MLQNYFRMQGWAASVVPARMVRDGSITPEALIAGHHPDAILFDVALPYEENWSALQALRNSPHVTCPIVVTTTNEAIVRRLTGTEESILEVVGKPYDLEQLFSSVNAAVHGEGPAHPRDVPDRRVADRRVGERRSSSHRTDPSTSDDSGRDSSRVVPWMRGAKRHIG
jgi:DNA-binding response OmpR family regulator